MPAISRNTFISRMMHWLFPNKQLTAAEAKLIYEDALIKNAIRDELLIEKECKFIGSLILEQIKLEAELGHNTYYFYTEFVYMNCSLNYEQINSNSFIRLIIDYFENLNYKISIEYYANSNTVKRIKVEW